ncbi:hypothetical protein HUU42_10495 [bacterium]|nr:hypothetical protein [bacterium]
MLRMLMGLFFLFIAGCKGDKNDQGSIFVDKDYDFVLGFAVPDEDRLAPTEVFVGRMLDQETDTFTINHIVRDTFLYGQLRGYQGWYRTVFAYHDDAEVLIHSETQTVQLQYVGYGIYQDVNDVLHIEPLKSYTLEVRRPDNRLYTKTVTVPGNLDVTNFNHGDTVTAYPKKRTVESATCIKLYPVIHNISEHAYLYRHKQSNDGPATDLYAIYASFQANSSAPAQYEECSQRTYQTFGWELLALDSSATIFYRSEGIAANQDVFDMIDYYDNGSIEKRSSLNTHGADDAIGNFGAYNAIRFDFTVKALRDSCQCD